MALTDLQRLDSIGCNDDLIAVLLKDTSDGSSQCGLILDEQNGFGALPVSLRRRTVPRERGVVFGYRHEDCELRSFPNRAIASDMSVMLAHNRVHGGQSESVAFSRFRLRAEKRFENVRLDFGGDAVSRVGNPQFQVLCLFQADIVRGLLFVVSSDRSKSGLSLRPASRPASSPRGSLGFVPACSTQSPPDTRLHRGRIRTGCLCQPGFATFVGRT